MKRKKYGLLIWGLCNFLLPIPLLMLGILLAWLIFFGFGGSYLSGSNTHDWLAIVALVPLFFIAAAHFVSSIAGVIVSIKKQKETFAFLCFILSDFSVVADAVLTVAILYIGSTF